MTSLHRVVGALGVLAVWLILLVSVVEVPVVDPDLWGQLAMGRETLLGGWPPLHDPFAYVPTLETLVYHEWLTGVTFYLMLQHLGAWSFQALRVVLGLSTLALAALAARRSGASVLSSCVILAFILPIVARGYSPVRAQMFTFFFFSLYIVLLEESGRGRPRLLWLLPPIGAIWANLHGGFVAGLALIFLYVVARLVAGTIPWGLIGAGLATMLASLLNPYGIRYWAYLAQAIPMARPYIGEWQPVAFDFRSLLGFKALVVLAALTFLATPRRQWRGVIVLAVAATVAFRHNRHLSFFAIASVAYLSPQLTPLLGRAMGTLRDRLARWPVLTEVLVAVMLGGLALGAVHQLRQTSWRLTVPASFYPVGAVEFIRVNHLAGNLATTFTWGEYALWKLYPMVKVSLDGRYETVYPERVLDDGFRLLYGLGGWWRMLEEYPTDMVLADKAYPMASVVREHPKWTAVYEDDVSVVYVSTAKRRASWIVPPRRDEGLFP